MRLDWTNKYLLVDIFIFALLSSQTTFDTVQRDKSLEFLHHSGVLFHLHQAIKAMYTVICEKVWSSGDTHDEVMRNIGIKQWGVVHIREISAQYLQKGNLL